MWVATIIGDITMQVQLLVQTMLLQQGLWRRCKVFFLLSFKSLQNLLLFIKEFFKNDPIPVVQLLRVAALSMSYTPALNANISVWRGAQGILDMFAVSFRLMVGFNTIYRKAYTPLRNRLSSSPSLNILDSTIPICSKLMLPLKEGLRDIHTSSPTIRV